MSLLREIILAGISFKSYFSSNNKNNHFKWVKLLRNPKLMTQAFFLTP